MDTIQKFSVFHKSDTDELAKTLIHYDGCFQPGDVALCGADLMGDSHLGWEPGEETTKKVNCESCKSIVAHVTKIIKTVKS